MNFLNYLFQTKETEKILQALDEFCKDIYQKLRMRSTCDFWFVLTTTEQETKKLIYTDSKELTRAIREGEKTPMSCVLDLIYEVTSWHCTSGKNHWGRGGLDLRGQAFYDILKYTLVNAEKMEIITKEESNKIMKEILEDIKLVG